MWNTLTIQILGLMVISAGLLSTFTRRIKIPHIILYLVTGLGLGIAERIILKEDVLEMAKESVNLISELGISLLLFLVGLELNLKKVKEVGKVAVFAGVGQVLFTALFGFLIGLGMNFSIPESIVIGVALTFSSTVVVVKLLGEKGHLGTTYGRISVGIFLIQDLIVIFVLTILAGVESAESFQGVGYLTGNMVKAVMGVIILLLFTGVFSKYLLKRAMLWSSSDTEVVFIWSLTWCLLVVMVAEYLNLSKEIGAFLAGVGLAQLTLSNSLKQRIHPLMNFFMGIFFIALGMKINVLGALKHLGPSIVFSSFVLIGNPIIFMAIIMKFKYSKKDSFLAGVTVAQISEFSFIFAAICQEKGLIDEKSLSVITFVGLITIIGSSFMIIYNEKMYRFLSSLKPFSFIGDAKQDTSEPKEESELQDHVIVVGVSSLGKKIVFDLSEKGFNVLAIDKDPARLKNLPCKTYMGHIEYSAVYKETNFQKAKLVVSTLHVEDLNNMIAFKCKELKIPMAIHGFDSSVKPDLKKLKVNYIIDTKMSWNKQLFEELGKLGVGLSKNPIS